MRMRDRASSRADVLQQQQRRLVGPVQVVQGDEQRRLLAHASRGRSRRRRRAGTGRPRGRLRCAARRSPAAGAGRGRCATVRPWFPGDRSSRSRAAGLGRPLVADLHPGPVGRARRRTRASGPRARSPRACGRRSPAPGWCASCRSRVHRRASPGRRDRRRPRRRPCAAAPAPSRGRRTRPAPAGRGRWTRWCAGALLGRVDLRQAASTSPAEAGRFAGSFASSWRMTSSSAGGQCSVSHEGATGGVLMCCEITAVGSSPSERRPAGHHLVEHAAEGVEVGLRRATRRRGPARAACRRRCPASCRACVRRERSSARRGRSRRAWRCRLR